mgnify:CR=1 FL=1
MVNESRGSAGAAGWQTLHRHEGAPPKPAYGAPCNGCGVCCLMEPCPIGIIVSRRRKGACSALRWDAAAQHYRCGLMDKAVLRPMVRRWIAAGSGCDAQIDVRPP